MSVVLLKDSLRPRYFISYSRKDSSLVSAMKTFLEGNASIVWYDVDQIAVGDKWMNEIETAILSCDELILFLSDASIQSDVVNREVSIARSLGKAIRPIKISSIRTPLPPSLSDLHYLDLSSSTNRPIGGLLLDYLGVNGASQAYIDEHLSLQAIKHNASRTIWPMFGERMLSRNGQTALATIIPILEQAIPNHSRASLILMNAGLINCILGAWERGVSQLRAHAEAAETMTAWYMYALHLNECSLIRSIPPGKGQEAMRAIGSVERFGTNPLCVLLNLVYGFGFNNLHHSRLPWAISKIQSAHAQGGDVGEEYLRFYWCVGRSLDAFGEYQSAIVNLIKTLGGRNG